MKTSKLSPAIRLSNLKEVYFHFSGNVKDHKELIESAKMFCYGMDGVGGFNFKNDDFIELGYVDLSLRYGNDIQNSFKITGERLSSTLLK